MDEAWIYLDDEIDRKLIVFKNELNNRRHEESKALQSQLDKFDSIVMNLQNINV